MNDKMITKFRWFWAWNDAAEAAWLRKMSAQGLHLAKPGFLGFYQFQSGEPKEYAFRLDFRPMAKTDWEAYLKIYRDAGWEYIGQMASWQYFRKDAAKAGPREIIPDKDSKIGMYRRLIIFVCFFELMMAVMLWSRLDTANNTGMSAITWILTVLVIFMVYAIIRLLIRMKQVGGK